MGFRQLPSGACQVRFQHIHTSYAATYPTHELAEDADTLLRAAVLTNHRAATNGDHEAIDTPRPAGPTPDLPSGQPLARVCPSPAAAAESLDGILADVIHDQVGPTPAGGETLTTGQAAALLWVFRPTLGAWLKPAASPSLGAASTDAVVA